MTNKVEVKDDNNRFTGGLLNIEWELLSFLFEQKISKYMENGTVSSLIILSSNRPTYLW